MMAGGGALHAAGRWYRPRFRGIVRPCFRSGPKYPCAASLRAGQRTVSGPSGQPGRPRRAGHQASARSPEVSLPSVSGEATSSGQHDSRPPDTARCSRRGHRGARSWGADPNSFGCSAGEEEQVLLALPAIAHSGVVDTARGGTRRPLPSPQVGRGGGALCPRGRSPERRSGSTVMPTWGVVPLPLVPGGTGRWTLCPRGRSPEQRSVRRSCPRGRGADRLAAVPRPASFEEPDREPDQFRCLGPNRSACAPGQAWERRMDEKLKPLERTLQRFNRCPGKVATTRNRVLRGRRRTDAAKRTQGVQLLRDRASKAQSLGASVVC